MAAPTKQLGEYSYLKNLSYNTSADIMSTDREFDLSAGTEIVFQVRSTNSYFRTAIKIPRQHESNLSSHFDSARTVLEKPRPAQLSLLSLSWSYNTLRTFNREFQQRFSGVKEWYDLSFVPKTSAEKSLIVETGALYRVCA